MSDFEYLKKEKGKALLLLLGLVLGGFFRVYFLDRETGDYHSFLLPWYTFIQENGFWGAFQHRFSDYTPAYLHLMAIATLFNFKALYAVKFISFIFEAVAGIGIYKLLKIPYKQGLLPLTGAIAFLLLPTVILNGSFWGQCDLVFTSMLIWAFYFVLVKRYFLAFLFLGFSFMFKLQSVFLFPFFAIITAKRPQLLKYWLLIPLIYLISIIPSLLVGRSLGSLLVIYLFQAQAYRQLTLNLPNIYNLLPDLKSYYTILFWVGISFTTALVLSVMVYVVRVSRSRELNIGELMKLSLLFALVIPYFLPHMHDRYYIIADVLSLVYVFYFRKHYFVPVIIMGASTLVYIRFLFGLDITPLWIASLAVSFCMTFLFTNTIKGFKSETSN